MKLDQIPEPENMNDERYFQINNVGSDRCGNYFHFCVTGNTTEEEIFKFAEETINEEMKIIKDRERVLFHSSFIFPFIPRKWHNKVKVKEQNRSIRKLSEPLKNGKKWCNEWKTKPKGLKFTLEKNWWKAVFTDGLTIVADEYKFGKKI